MKIVVYCEGHGNTALELIGKARAIAPQSHIIALCEGNMIEAEGYQRSGANEGVAIGCLMDDAAQGARIAQAFEQLSPDAGLFPATVRGRFLSAWVAAKLNTGLTADCTELKVTPDELLLQIRPAFGGNLTAEILCKTARPQLASVRPGVFTVPQAGDIPKSWQVSELPLKTVCERMERYAFTPVDHGVSLQSASVIVAGGKGIGSAKGFDKLFELADLLHGAVGATRSAVDAGWIPYAHQIGQTGITVRPQLYFAFGMRGLVQHVVGMNGSGTVVAVNSDSNAPIFACADFGIVGDWRETIDAMIQYYKQKEAF